jgi:hypothetical protein
MPEYDEDTQERWARLSLTVKKAEQNVEVSVLAAERGEDEEQHRIQFGREDTREIPLPAGEYLIQVIAENYHPEKFAVQLEAGRTTEYTVSLKPQKDQSVPFERRLKAYGFSPKQAVDKIELREKEHRIVKNQEDQPGLVRVEAKTLEDVKRFIGAPAGVFGDDRPRFGEVKISQETIKRLRKKDRKALVDEDIVLADLAKEYLFGNSEANGALVRELSPLLSVYVGRVSLVALLCRELTIPAGATYEFGPGTLVLHRLRIHTTGRLVPRGQCKFDIDTWEQFS